ncbi:hypothetical protein ABDB91_18870 [Desulfoscipio sp. XC116]|uniref:hypothetical protein n=1 Tax=Desulfoscipio sp. XC116 TaxID=3144975 RepID=UPI00325A9B32
MSVFEDFDEIMEHAHFWNWAPDWNVAKEVYRKVSDSYSVQRLIALAKVYAGILASNNLKDISKYVEKYDLEHVDTGGILVSALNAGYIDENTETKFGAI